MIWLTMFLELKQVLIHMRERTEVEMLQNHYCIEFCKQNGIPHGIEVYSTEYDELRDVLGTDKKRFDFVVKTQSKAFLMK